MVNKRIIIDFIVRCSCFKKIYLIPIYFEINITLTDTYKRFYYRVIES